MPEPEIITEDLAQKILRRDEANLVKKVTAGKTLSRTERAFVEAKSATSKGRTVESIAARWAVDRKSVQRWIKRHGRKVVENDVELAECLLATGKIPDRVSSLCQEILGIAPDDDPPSDVGAEAVNAIDDLPELARRVTAHLDRADRDIAKARRDKNANMLSAALKAFRELAVTLNSIRRTQAAIGQDAGDLIAKVAAVQVVSAWSSRAALGIQRARDILAPRVLNLKTESEAAAAIDDVLIGELYLGPFEAALNTASGCAMPEWFANAIVKVVGETISGGEHKLKGNQ